jgi:hypothetical protein
MRVRRGLVRAGAWAGATAAAVSVSWFGVHRVLLDGSTEPPSPLVLTAAAPSPPAALPSLPSEIGSPAQTPAPSATPGRSTHPSAPHSATADPGPTATSGSGTPPGSGTGTGTDPAGGRVTSYTPVGGLVVASVGSSSASFVSATPSAGWSVSWVPGDHYFRVDFQRGGTDSVFYMTWNGHPPLVQTDVLNS